MSNDDNLTPNEKWLKAAEDALKQKMRKHQFQNQNSAFSAPGWSDIISSLMNTPKPEYKGDVNSNSPEYKISDFINDLVDGLSESNSVMEKGNKMNQQKKVHVIDLSDIKNTQTQETSIKKEDNSKADNDYAEKNTTLVETGYILKLKSKSSPLWLVEHDENKARKNDDFNLDCYTKNISRAHVFKTEQEAINAISDLRLGPVSAWEVYKLFLRISKDPVTESRDTKIKEINKKIADLQNELKKLK